MSILPEYLARYARLSLLYCCLAGTQTGYGQTPSDAVLMLRNSFCFLANYEQGRFDRYWEGGRLRSNATVATVQRQTFLPMVAYAVSDRLNLYVGLPYVASRSLGTTGGQLAGVKGFQDFGAAAKYEFLHKDLPREGRLQALASLGVVFPATRYLADYMPYSLGMGCPEISARAIVQYRFRDWAYARASGAHLWRTYARTEREFYYANGTAIYSEWMDVPNAWHFQGVIGKEFLANALKIELSYTGFRSTSGDDIRPYTAPQPTNRVHNDGVGAFAQYYFTPDRNISVLAYTSRILAGRNCGKVQSFGAGFTYLLRLSPQKTSEK